MQASHPVVMTDPGQFPAGTNAAVMTYSQMQVWASGNGASGSGWVTVQGSGSVNLTAIQNGSGQVVGYAGLTANATVEAVKYTVASAYIVVNDTRYNVTVPNSQTTANVTGSTNAAINSTILVDITPTIVATYNQNATTVAL